MACPTCDHTMQGIDTRSDVRVFWCPRCGTIKCVQAGEWHEAPLLAAKVFPHTPVKARIVEVTIDLWHDKSFTVKGPGGE